MSTHQTQFRVRYGETDQAGVVYYGNYLLYFEVGRTEHMRALGMPYAEVEARGYFLAIADAYCKYLGSAKYDDLVAVRTRIAKVSLTCVVFDYELANETTGELIATGRTTLACLDRGRKPTRMPEDLRELLESARAQ